MEAPLDLASLFSVKGKIALITGGGSGLGSYIAKALAVNGARVYITGRRVEKLERVAKECREGEIIPLQGDVSNKETIAKLVQDFGKHEKTLDILVNAAGVLLKDPVVCAPDDTDKLAEALFSPSYEDWQHVMGINVSSLYFTSTGFAPLLHAAALANPATPENPRESPCIINISSVAGLHNSRTAGAASYAVSKSAVHHLTKTLATRFLPLNIRCNCLAPGLFPSEMSNPDVKTISQTHKEHFKGIPLGRAGLPAEIAGPVIMLCSRAGAYMNSNILDISGGRTLVVSGYVVPDKA